MGCFSCSGNGGGGGSNNDAGVGAIQSLGWNPGRASELVTSTYVRMCFCLCMLIVSWIYHNLPARLTTNYTR